MDLLSLTKECLREHPEYLSLYTKEWLREHPEEFPKIISSFLPNPDIIAYREIIEKINAIFIEKGKNAMIEGQRLFYLSNSTAFVGIIRKISGRDDIYHQLIQAYNEVFKQCGDDNEYADLTDAYMRDIIIMGGEQDLIKSIIENRNIDQIKKVIHRCEMKPINIIWNASFNSHENVHEFVYDYFNDRNVEFTKKDIYICRGNVNLFRKMTNKIESIDDIAGRIITSVLQKPSEILQDLLNYLKERSVNISSVICDEKDHEGRSPLHNCARNGNADNLQIIIANLQDNDLQYLLSTQQYVRTPLGHAQYYNYKECCSIIEAEMKRLNLI